MQKWGHQNDKQRYHCTDCFHNFSGGNKGVSAANQFVWFEKWVMERQVYKYLVRDSGMSQSSLQRLFNRYLSSPPKNVIKSKGNVHLLIDGTYFSNGLCLILYYDNDIQYVQLFRNTDKEKYREIKEDLSNLKKLSVDVYSVTCDGHNAIIKAVKKVYPDSHCSKMCGARQKASPVLVREVSKITGSTAIIANHTACYKAQQCRGGR